MQFKGLVNRFFRSRAGLFVTALAFALLTALTSVGGFARAADPTDAAGMITAVSAVFTAFPVLTIIVMAVAIVALGTFLARRARSASKV